MKKKKIYLLLFLIAMVISINVNVSAFSSSIGPIKQSGYKVWLNGYDKLALKYYGSTAVFCTQFHKDPPSKVNANCKLSDGWSTSVRAGVATIIEKVGKVSISGNAPKNYYYGELAINEFLCSSGVSAACVSSNRTPSQILGSNYYLYEAAIDQKDKVNDVIDNISISINNATTTSDSNNYYITTSVSKSKADGYTVSTTKGTATKNGDNITITIPKTSLSQGSNSITITVRAYNNEYIARNYSCGTNYQTITPAHTELAEIASKTATKTVTINIQSQGNIEITKTNSKTGAAIKDVIFYFYEGAGCDAYKYKNKYKTNSSGIINITNLTPGTYSVLEIEDGQTQSILDNYKLEVYNRNERCTNITVSAGQTATPKIENEPKGTLKILKKNNLGNPVMNAGFTIYRGTGCNSSSKVGEYFTNAKGIIEKILDSNSYSVKETKKSSNHYLDPEDKCYNVTVSAGGTATVNNGNAIINELACQYYLDEIKANYSGNEMKQKLIDLYQNNYYDINGEKAEVANVGTYNGLLNFSSPSCAAVTCSVNYSDTCLKTIPQKINSNNNVYFSINRNNVSCYNDTIEYNNKTYYCESYFLFSDHSIFGASYPANINKNNIVNSGRFYLSAKDSTKPTFLNQFWKVCYIPGITNPKSESTINSVLNAYNSGFNYGNYFSNMKLYIDERDNYKLQLVNKDGTEIDESDIKFVRPSEVNGIDSKYNPYLADNTGSNYNHGEDMFLFGAIAYYKLPKIWLKQGSGEKYTTSCNNCIFGGNGIITRFTYTGNISLKLVYDFKSSTNSNQYFEVEHDSTNASGDKKINMVYPKNNGEIYSSFGVCDFTANQQIIKGNSKLELEFRTVKTNSDSSFLSKTGTGDRQSGSNWSDENTRKRVLKENNDSYNKNNESMPMYKITLTPSKIQTIRNYNKNKTYDDFDLTCKDNGKYCISNYLTTLRDSYGLEIINSRPERDCVENNNC